MTQKISKKCWWGGVCKKLKISAEVIIRIYICIIMLCKLPYTSPSWCFGLPTKDVADKIVRSQRSIVLLSESQLTCQSVSYARLPFWQTLAIMCQGTDSKMQSVEQPMLPIWLWKHDIGVTKHPTCVVHSCWCQFKVHTHLLQYSWCNAYCLSVAYLLTVCVSQTLVERGGMCRELDGSSPVIRQQLYCRHLSSLTTSHCPDTVYSNQYWQHCHQQSGRRCRQARLDYCNCRRTSHPTYHRCQSMLTPHLITVNCLCIIKLVPNNQQSMTFWDGVAHHFLNIPETLVESERLFSAKGALLHRVAAPCPRVSIKSPGIGRLRPGMRFHGN